MKFRTLGKSGYQISEMGIGCWQLGNDFGPLEDERAMAIVSGPRRFRAALAAWAARVGTSTLSS